MFLLASFAASSSESSVPQLEAGDDTDTGWNLIFDPYSILLSFPGTIIHPTRVQQRVVVSG